VVLLRRPLVAGTLGRRGLLTSDERREDGPALVLRMFRDPAGNAMGFVETDGDGPTVL
jgi:hypothetical protein